jgi:hypothetical protein
VKLGLAHYGSTNAGGVWEQVAEEVVGIWERVRKRKMVKTAK